MITTKRQRSVFAISLLAAASLWAGLASAQTFVSQGPAPSFGPTDTVQSGDQPPNGTVSGAIQAIAISPSNSSTMFVGTPNGGIWVTRNGGSSWQPLTDNKVSLSISSVAFDPTNGQNLIAGIGATSNGRIGNASGGQLTGILYSNNGGTSWTDLAGSGDTLQGKNIVSVAARGGNLLAAANNPVTQGGGLYYSPNGGGSFSLVPGLAAGSVGALAADNSSANANGTGTRFYAAVSAAANPAANGVYLGDPTNSANWAQVLQLPANQVAKLATGPGGSVVAAVYDSSTGNPTSGRLVAVYLSQNAGATWTSMTSNLPNTNPGRQASSNLAVAIDPNNSNIVYLAGDGIGMPPHTLGAYRLTLNGTSFSVDSLTDNATANGSTAHADARTLVFDSSGRLIFGGDGGIYVRTNPASDSGAWTGLNTSTLSVREIYGIAYDGVSKRLIVAAQDTGTAFQANPNSANYNAVQGGDGANAIVNDRSSRSQSIIYYSSQSLGGLTRMTVNAQGAITSSNLVPNLNFAPDDLSMPGDDNPAPALPFFSRIVFNRKDPSRIAIATNYVYTTTDYLLFNNPAPLTNLGQIVGTISSNSTVTALAYGTRDDVDALLVGSTFTTGPPDTPVTNNWLLLANKTTPLTRLTGYGGDAPTSVVFDYRAAAHYYIADGTRLWTNQDATTATAFNDLTGNLTPLNLTRPTATEFIHHNGVNALVVGALSTVDGSPSPLAVADSPTPGQLVNWRLFGNGIPNTIIGQLSYSPTVDVLAVGTFGRGAWLLYDVTTYFASATKLVYGAADNDSNPDAIWLTGNRPLEKVGAGTLTIAGNASYTGSTTVSNGTMVVNGSIASSSGLTVGPMALVRGTGTLPATSVFGTIWPGNNAMGALSVNNNLTFNPGSTYIVEANAAGQGSKIAVNGSATILGGTVNAMLQSGVLYAPRTTYTIVSSSGGVSGAFSSLTASGGSSFLQPSLVYDANNAYLNLTINGFLAAAQTPTQAAVGGALDASVLQASGDYATVLSTLANLSPSQIPAILTSLSGQNYSGFSNSMVQGAQLFMNNFLAQASSANRGQGKIALAEACDVACDTTEPARWGAWGGALGGLGTVGTGQLAGVTYNVGGFAGGLDRKITDNFLAGVTVGYTSGSQWVSGFTGQGFSNTVQAGLYGGYAQGPVYLDGIVGYAYSANNLSRSIQIPGLAPRLATGQTGANQVYGQAEGGYRFDLGGPLASFVTPFARLQAYSGTQNAFTESGAQSLDLSVVAQTTNSLRTVLGAQLGGGVDLGWRDKLFAQVRLGWSHEYADVSRPVAVSFVGAPSAPFTTYGASPQRDGAVVGLAANTAVGDAVSLYLRYEGNFSGQDTTHALTAGVRMTW